ncbi:MAG: hypothetical protein Q8Q36_00160 [bacterium]|nr:hypothetical protein [bacterium]
MQVNTAHAVGSPEYLEMLERIERDKVCPFCVDFCQDKPPTYHPNQILLGTKWWVATPSVRKYKGAVKQFLFVPKTHVLEPWQLPEEAWANLQFVIREVTKMENMPAAAFLMRFGDTDYTGASVVHLHANLIMGVSREEGTEPLLAYIGYQKPE